MAGEQEILVTENSLKEREIQRDAEYPQSLAAEPACLQYNDRSCKRYLKNWKSYLRLAQQRLDGLLDGDPGHTKGGLRQQLASSSIDISQSNRRKRLGDSAKEEGDPSHVLCTSSAGTLNISGSFDQGASLPR